MLSIIFEFIPVQKTASEVLKTKYFSYSALWSTGQWEGCSPPPPPPPPPPPLPLATLLLLRDLQSNKARLKPLMQIWCCHVARAEFFLTKLKPFSLNLFDNKMKKIG